MAAVRDEDVGPTQPRTDARLRRPRTDAWLRRPTSRGFALVAIASLALALAVVKQESGPNQAAHFALTRALADGTARIDPEETIDAAYVDGHYYAAKAPGLAMFTLPWFAALHPDGLDQGSLALSVYPDRLWEVNLFGVVLPAVALLLLIFVAVERVVPGYAGTTAVLLGAGTLLLPFATLFFGHVLSATLGFAAFVVLLVERGGPPRPWITGAAGLLAGLAVVAEFPLAIVVLVLGAFVWAGEPRALRLASYATGALVGLVPLLAYNTWAFGSPLRLSYTNALEAPAGEGPPLVGANDEGFYGVGFPDLRSGLSLLLSEKGLVVVTPLAIVALAGWPLLWRSGRRAETLVCAAIPVLFGAYNASYYLPFGGQGPGPRFLVPAIPFLALPLAFALRARPLLVAGIGVASVTVMVLATLTSPLTGVEYGIGTWLGELRRGELVRTVVGSLGVGNAWLAAVPFVGFLVLALAIALAHLPLRDRLGSDGTLLAGALLAWLLVVLVTPDLLPADAEHGTTVGALAAVVLVASLGIALFLARTRGFPALLAIAPALVLAAPQLASRPRLSLLVAVAAMAVAASVGWRLRPDRGPT